MQRLSVKPDNPAAYDEAVHGGLPELGDLQIASKAIATKNGKPAVSISFKAELDGQELRVQAVTTLELFLSCSRVLKAVHAADPSLESDGNLALLVTLERDAAETWADGLANALVGLLGVEVGEHSSGNNLWEKALGAVPVDEIDRLRVFQRAKAAPLVGNVLDMWDGLPADLRSDPGLESLGSAVDCLRSAMEDEDE